MTGDLYGGTKTARPVFFQCQSSFFTVKIIQAVPDIRKTQSVPV
jgi:hypothetical protein